MSSDRRSQLPYSVNIAVLDAQHQRLVALVDKLEQDLAADSEDVVVEDVLHSLVQYTIYHFAEEEDLMHKHRFPGLPAHRLEHHDLTMKIARAEEEYKSGKQDVLPSLAQYLRSWLENHVLQVDQQYSEFLNARGVY